MNDRTAPGFLDVVLDRTLGNLRAAWRDISASARGAVGAGPRPDLPSDDAQRLHTQMRDCLDGKGGEVSARQRAAELGRTYLELSAIGRDRFLRMLAGDFGCDHDAVKAAAEALIAAEPDKVMRAERDLARALEAPRVRLLKQFNGLPEGVKFLVDLRAELLPIARGDPALAALDADLHGLLASWFDVGFLELRRITWEAPAALLEKLIAYEAVHAIRDWRDLKNRLEADRRCFAFFHPRMPDEPLIFVEVALVNGISGHIEPLLDESAPVADPKSADTAIFYSISNCQRGLDGISFGNFLIKRVVDLLAGELRNLKTFATLSPIPGFRTWLDGRIADGGFEALLRPGESDAVAAAAHGVAGGAAAALADGTWLTRPALADALRPPLERLGATYLTSLRPKGRRAIDPVAHFHLTNGARVERLDWLADPSDKGMRQSFGMMVNYLYRFDSIDTNHEAYRGEGKISASSPIRALAKG
ncbi:malonyl-CoA decarboxylase [Stella humosa]|uniref:Malonyl-CoA decarboxylase n=1 Tax=Stella humosa TaxID=94 RepID=A0A3N1MEW3_9PROT|nr:malonyl-CoA decarboxylase [Stella humosa]ROQ01705.1 malonyl-CoA decarboxylase [Stella humosa]BBK32086.1 malonyl-CoA decarboxylase [Stella humosa]